MWLQVTVTMRIQCALPSPCIRARIVAYASLAITVLDYFLIVPDKQKYIQAGVSILKVLRLEKYIDEYYR